MSVTTKDDLLSLDWVSDGQPFAQVAGRTDAITIGLEFVYRAQPFVANAPGEDFAVWGSGTFAVYGGGYFGSALASLGSGYAPAGGAGYSGETSTGRASGVLVETSAMTAYYSSPGGLGDYADASTNVAARVVFPGTPPVCTILCWARDMAGTFFYVADDGTPSLSMSVAGELDAYLYDDAAGESDLYAVADPGAAAWGQFAIVCNGTTATAYGNGVADFAPVAYPGGSFAATNSLALLIDGAGIGKIRNIMLIDRALTADEIADLYAAGPTHNPLNATGTHWAAGQSIPVIWNTAAVAGAVANSGDGGTCNLVLHGAVTSELDPPNSAGVSGTGYLPGSDGSRGAGATAAQGTGALGASDEAQSAGAPPAGAAAGLAGTDAARGSGASSTSAAGTTASTDAGSGSGTSSAQGAGLDGLDTGTRGTGSWAAIAEAYLPLTDAVVVGAVEFWIDGSIGDLEAWGLVRFIRVDLEGRVTVSRALAGTVALARAVSGTVTLARAVSGTVELS